MHNLKALAAYLEVATLGSPTLAAQRLGTSQPSISRMIKDLERDLGQPLFQRIGQRLVLTNLGMLLRDDVERALGGVAEVWERARAISDEVKPLRIAAVSAFSFGLLPHAWNRLDPVTQGQLIVETTGPEQVRSNVKTGHADLGAGSLPLAHRDLEIQWMASAPCVLALRNDDPLASEQGPVQLSALKGRTLIELSNKRGLPNRLRRALRESGLDAPSILTNSTMNALSFVQAGLGISVIEPVTPAGAHIPGLTILPLEIPIPYYFGVVTSATNSTTGLCQTLTDALRKEARERLSDFTIHPPETHQDLLVQLSLAEDRP